VSEKEQHAIAAYLGMPLKRFQQTMCKAGGAACQGSSACQRFAHPPPLLQHAAAAPAYFPAPSAGVASTSCTSDVLAWAGVQGYSRVQGWRMLKNRPNEAEASGQLAAAAAAAPARQLPLP
jgi:hypothetical protein